MRPANSIATSKPPYVAPWSHGRQGSIIDERLTTYPELSATRVFEEVRAIGYAGGITQVRAYVARARPKPTAEPVVRFETPPAHQAHVDLAEFRFPREKRYALLVVLGYARLLWLKFYPRQTLATIIVALEEAIAYFGGFRTSCSSISSKRSL